MSLMYSIITARIRRMGEGNIFTLCVSPHLDQGGGALRHPRSGWVGYPIPGLGGGTPSQVWMEGTPSQVWVGGTPSQVWVGGVLHPRSG